VGVAGCPLCAERLQTPILHESTHWRVALNRNQSLFGKLVVVLRRHEESVAALTEAEWSELQGDVRWATERLRAAFAPDHFNYAFLQNQDRHVHLHVTPRYATPREVGGERFLDADYPDHYRVPAPERRLSVHALEVVARALAG
jgi:diadenosine tetraphosphate (Ap4A) HIT family hydrolase